MVPVSVRHACSVIDDVDARFAVLSFESLDGFLGDEDAVAHEVVDVLGCGLMKPGLD